MRSLLGSPLVGAALRLLNRSNVHCLDGMPGLLRRAADELDALYAAAYEVRDRARDALS